MKKRFDFKRTAKGYSLKLSPKGQSSVSIQKTEVEGMAIDSKSQKSMMYEVVWTNASEFMRHFKLYSEHTVLFPHEVQKYIDRLPKELADWFSKI